MARQAHSQTGPTWRCGGVPGSASHHLLLRPSLITPLIDDKTWLRQLTSLAPWQPPSQPTLVVAPHPDDETLGAGALIATLRAQGVPVTVVAVTDGENCYDVPQPERERIRRLREQEQAAALALLGVPHTSIHRLHLRDSGLHLQEAVLKDRLAAIAQPGTHLVAPWAGDFHPDHEACARAAAAVAEVGNLSLTSYFFWTWHRGTEKLLSNVPVRRFLPDSEALRAKTAALACHRSQLEWPDGQPILPDNLLGPARWPFEVFLPA